MEQKDFNEFKEQLEAKLEKLKENFAGTEKVDELQKSLDEKFEQASTKEDFDKIEKSVNDLSEKLNKMSEKEDDKPTSLKDSILDVVQKDDFKEKIKRNYSSEFEVKVDSDDFVGTVYRSESKPGITFEKLTENTVIPLFNTVSMPASKDRIVWLEGSATINVGYVDEGNAAGSNSTGSTTQKSRELAKISAIMPFTSESLDMPEAFASRMQRRMQDATRVWLDEKLIKGDGSDGSNPDHIYGLVSKGSTAFSAPSGLIFKSPTIDDLVDAALVQANPYKPTHVLMNMKTRVKYSKEKDTTGQYILRRVEGKLMLGGLQVVETEGMDDEKLLIVDRSTLEFWIKRNMSMIVTQMDSDDVSKDKWKAILFWRGQSLVDGNMLKGNIYISDIESSLATITEATS